LTGHDNELLTELLSRLDVSPVLPLDSTLLNNQLVICNTNPESTDIYSSLMVQSTTSVYSYDAAATLK
jgi:hypothetical protein